MTLSTDTDSSRAPERNSAGSYDRLPYPSLPYPLTHPDRLAVMASLHGLAPVCPAKARILEIGCASGGNLIPLACNMPESRCLGIDISPNQINTGRETLAALGLGNIQLEVTDILEFKSDSRFDYIIAHGVYSWIPPATQRALLSLVRHHLSPQGVAYISYNVYPGFMHNTMMRDIMQYHTRSIQDPGKRAGEALGFVGFLADAAARCGSGEADRLQSFHEQLMARPERLPLLFHEYLESDNHPLYFREFAKRVEEEGLFYIGDADPAPHDPVNTPRGVRTAVDSWSEDRIALQQYLDIIHNTRFRRSLVCLNEASAKPEMSVEAVTRLFATTQTHEGAPSEAEPTEGPRFITRTGTTFTPTHPSVTGILRFLRTSWPTAVSYPCLAERFPAEDLAPVLLSLFRSGIIDLHTAAPACLNTVSDKPFVNAYSRHQAKQARYVTNLFHHPIKVDDDMARFLLPRLDGSRTIRDLAAEMETAVKDGRLQLDYRGKPLCEQVGLDGILPSFVEFHVGKLVQLALLSA